MIQQTFAMNLDHRDLNEDQNSDPNRCNHDLVNMSMLEVKNLLSSNSFNFHSITIEHYHSVSKISSCKRKQISGLSSKPVTSDTD